MKVLIDGWMDGWVDGWMHWWCNSWLQLVNQLQWEILHCWKFACACNPQLFISWFITNLTRVNYRAVIGGTQQKKLLWADLLCKTPPHESCEALGNLLSGSELCFVGMALPLTHNCGLLGIISQHQPIVNHYESWIVMNHSYLLSIMILCTTIDSRLNPSTGPSQVANRFRWHVTRSTG